MARSIQRNTGRYEFSSVANMRAFLGGTGLTNGETAYLSSDANSGMFKWNSSSTTTDDGVDVIKLTAVATGRFLRLERTYNQGGTGAADTTVKAKLQEYVSITDFTGADATGTTDSSTAINNALASGAQRIRVPKGTFLADALDLPTGGITLFGEGTIKHNDAATDHLFTAADGDVRFEGITLDGNKANNAGTRFDLFRADVLTKRKVYFDMVTFKGHVASGCYFASLAENTNVTFTFCKWEDPAESTADTTTSYPDQSLAAFVEQARHAHVSFYGCNFNNSSYTNVKRVSAGIQLQGNNGTSTGYAITATDATLTDSNNGFREDMVGYYVRVEGAGTAGGQFFSRIASYTSAGSVELEDVAVTTVSGATGYWATDKFKITVSNCDFFQFGNEANISMPIDIYAFGQDVNIHHNRIVDSGYGGIRVANSFGTNMDHNIVRGYIGTGLGTAIKFQGAVRTNYAAVYDSCSMVGNEVYDWLGSEAYAMIGDDAGGRYLDDWNITANCARNVLGGISLDGCGKGEVNGNIIDGVTHAGSTYAGVLINDSIGPIGISGGSINNSATYGIYSATSADLVLNMNGVKFEDNTNEHWRIDVATADITEVGNIYKGTPTQALRTTAASLFQRGNKAPASATVNVAGVTSLDRWGSTYDMIRTSSVYDPPSIPDGDEVIETIVVSGISLGDYVVGVSFSIDLQDLTLSAAVRATDTLDVSFTNNTGAAVDLGSGTIKAVIQKA